MWDVRFSGQHMDTKKYLFFSLTTKAQYVVCSNDMSFFGTLKSTGSLFTVYVVLLYVNSMCNGLLYW